jgi:hypothetical protein
MPRRRELARSLGAGGAVLLACAVALGACGSKTKVVTAQEPPSPRSGQTIGGATTQTHTGATPPAPAQGNGGTPAATTRTASEPAFTKAPTNAEGLAAAGAAVRARGFTPTDPSAYHASQTLRVLLGTRHASSGSATQRAFFFVNGRFIGTDSSADSARVKVVSQADTEVTLAYALYRRSDPQCCPGGGSARVRFQLNNGALVALDPIPASSTSAASSRR